MNETTRPSCASPSQRIGQSGSLPVPTGLGYVPDPSFEKRLIWRWQPRCSGRKSCGAGELFRRFKSWANGQLTADPRVRRLVHALLGLAIGATSWPGVSHAGSYVTSRVTPPPISREMRAAWIASVANIDWPSTNSLTPAAQKAELVAIMEQAVRLKLNTLIFQVRPACDALYASSIEPWSEYLTGTMGQAPKPLYDPLTFAIQEAHKRGLELHAWFDPYRARLPTAKSPVSANHVSRQHPEYVRHYGKMLWLDPGEKAVQAYSLSVVMDVVKRYDIDGVHFDDYFYPYKEKDSSGRELDFPDEPSWRRFGAGGQMSRDEWRRDNVNTFIQKVYQGVKAAKSWVKFGVSPFGIWRPGNPAQIQGLDAYAVLYADSRRWLAEGDVDYLAPQLYWPIKPPAQSFPVLLKWWADQNAKGRVVVAGIDSTKAGRKWASDEILNQVRITRSTAAVNGHCHWNMKALMRNPELAELLSREVYSRPAVAPALSWVRSESPARPAVNVPSTGGKVSWKSMSAEPIRLWLVQTRKGQEWTTSVIAGTQKDLSFHGDRPDVVAVTAVDRYGNASPAAVMEFSNSLR
jgi:uncharacterized lipoprotein YddW (UPF0748 family)